MKNTSSSADSLPNYINVEVTSVDKQQVTNFTNKWFQVKQPFEYKQFPKKPQTNNSLSEITTDPLLTMLCLVFEEKSQLPSELSQLYREGIEILLSKWNHKHQFEGDWGYKNLSLQQKKDLLSQIALKTFESGDYFYKQELEQYITDFICNLADAPTNPEALQLNSEAVLKALVLQHGLLVEWATGIYAFSDFKFHQYFIARGIVESSSFQALEQGLQNLVSHITEPHWYEVFLLVVGMLQNADYLLKLIKQQTNALIASDAQLQHFLAWLNQKSISGEAFCKPSAFRAFCLEFILELECPAEDNFTYNLKFEPARNLRKYSHDLQNFPFSKQQKQILKQYYDANQLLLGCLKNARFVTCNLREEIKGTLLVPLEIGSQIRNQSA